MITLLQSSAACGDRESTSQLRATVGSSARGEIGPFQKDGRLALGRTVKVCVEGHEALEIPLPDKEVTCQWLLDEVNTRCQDRVVALRTSSNNETMDFYLTLGDRVLPPLSNNDTLIVCCCCEESERLGDDRRELKREFEIVKMIGKGGFSSVYEVRHRSTGRIFAMKVIKKESLEKENKVKQVLSEKAIMEQLGHPCVVKLHWAFQSKTKLHFVMDFCAGGELFYHLRNVGRLTEEQAKFYFAEIVLGLEYLHSHSVVYRDLKPENVLLDIDGHVRLADFGLSKDGITLSTLTHSFCGSPEYMSPEMLQQTGHSLTMDYYSLGALVFEMLVGLPPHYSTDRDEMYGRILDEPLILPKSLSSGLRSLLSGLLKKDPKQRLGSKRGIEEIKEHPWCSSIKWESYLSHKIEPPFRPNLRQSHFAPEYTQCPVEDNRKTERSYSCYWEGNSGVLHRSTLGMDQSECSSVLDTQREDKYEGFSFVRAEPKSVNISALGAEIGAEEDLFCADIPSIRGHQDSSKDKLKKGTCAASDNTQPHAGDVTENEQQDGQGPGKTMHELGEGESTAKLDIEKSSKLPPVLEPEISSSGLYDESLISVAQEHLQDDSVVKAKVSVTPMKKKDFGVCRGLMADSKRQVYVSSAIIPMAKPEKEVLRERRENVPASNVKEKAKQLLNKMLSPKTAVQTKKPGKSARKSKENKTTFNKGPKQVANDRTRIAGHADYPELFVEKATELMHKTNTGMKKKSAGSRPFMNGPLFRTAHLGTNASSRQTVACPAAKETQSRNPEGKSVCGALLLKTHTIGSQKSFDRTELGRACFQYVNKEQKRINEFMNVVVVPQTGDKKGCKCPKTLSKVVPVVGSTNPKSISSKVNPGFMTAKARGGGTTTAPEKNKESFGPLAGNGMRTTRDTGSVANMQKRSNSSGGHKQRSALARKDSAGETQRVAKPGNDERTAAVFVKARLMLHGAAKVKIIRCLPLLCVWWRVSKYWADTRRV